jgi:phosphatidylglycerophosphate synthase
LSLRTEYRRSLKLIEVEEPVDLAIYRPLGFALVKAISGTSITPNQITIFSIFVGVLAGLCYAFGHRTANVAGATLFAFSIVLDCADGQLARLKKNGTRLGRILDGLVDYVVDLSVCAGLAVGATPEEHRLKWALLLLAAAATYLVHSIALDYYRNRFMDVVQGTTTHIEDEDDESFRKELAELRERRGRRVRKAVLGLYLRYCELQKRLAVRKNGLLALSKLDPEDFRRRNKMALRGWTWLGSSTANTWFIAMTLLDRIDLFFWGIIVVSNVWAVIMYVVQGRIDQRSAEEALS